MQNKFLFYNQKSLIGLRNMFLDNLILDFVCYMYFVLEPTQE